MKKPGVYPAFSKVVAGAGFEPAVRRLPDYESLQTNRVNPTIFRNLFFISDMQY
jgi:hypothetical protein